MSGVPVGFTDRPHILSRFDWGSNLVMTSGDFRQGGYEVQYRKMTHVLELNRAINALNFMEKTSGTTPTEAVFVSVDTSLVVTIGVLMSPALLQRPAPRSCRQ